MRISRPQIYDFLILAMRWYLAFYMISYGWSKLNGGQFHVHNPAILDMPLKKVNNFYLAWHLFGKSITFNVVVGIMQILGALLILFNRTLLIGALVLLPILFQIFLVDVSFTMGMFGYALPFRLGFMVLYDLIILYYYKDRMLAAWRTLTSGTRPRFHYSWWVFLLMPFVGFLTDFVSAVIYWPLKVLLQLF